MAQEFVSAEQYRYALANFRIAHERVESQRVQLEEQERQIALLRERISLLEGGDEPAVVQRAGSRQGGSSVDDFSIKNAASALERQINRWAADTVRAPPVPLSHLRDAILADIGAAEDDLSEAQPAVVQNLLRHAMSEAISEGVINCLIITNSSEANVQLTRIHEHIFARDPTVACVWRRQTFTAAVESCSPEMTMFIISEHMPVLASLLSPDEKRPHPSCVAILDAAYAFSRMLHGSRSSSGGDAFYRAFVPEVGSILYPRQIELVKRCLKSERGEIDRVGSTVFPGLVKVSRGPPDVNGQTGETVQTVVRRAQCMCECALIPMAAIGQRVVESAQQ